MNDTTGEPVVFIYLGDLLLVTVFPLVMRKGFGSTAGRVALVLGFAVIAGILRLPSITRVGCISQ